jgi:hypothetical protein
MVTPSGGFHPPKSPVFASGEPGKGVDTGTPFIEHKPNSTPKTAPPNPKQRNFRQSYQKVRKPHQKPISFNDQHSRYLTIDSSRRFHKIIGVARIICFLKA